MWTDPGDPVEQVIAAETAADHKRAKARGLRVLELTDVALGALDGHGLLRDQEQARVVVFGAIADALYGNLSIDIPTLLRG